MVFLEWLLHGWQVSACIPKTINQPSGKKGVGSMNIYQTEIQEIGENASEFLSLHMLVLFGGEAPPELKPFCFIIEKNILKGVIEPGDVLWMDDQKYHVKSVGNQVNRNLAELGHITLNFQEEAEQDMAGTLYLEPKKLIDLKKGSILKINKSV